MAEWLSAGMVTLDYWAVFFKVLFGLTGLVTVLMSGSYLESHRRHLGEYYALLIFAVIGLDLMAAARDFILFYVAFELMSISSYLLAAYFRYRVEVQRVRTQVFPDRLVRLGGHALRDLAGLRGDRLDQLPRNRCRRWGSVGGTRRSYSSPSF